MGANGRPRADRTNVRCLECGSLVGQELLGKLRRLCVGCVPERNARSQSAWKLANPAWRSGVQRVCAWCHHVDVPKGLRLFCSERCSTDAANHRTTHGVINASTLDKCPDCGVPHRRKMGNGSKRCPKCSIVREKARDSLKSAERRQIVAEASELVQYGVVAARDNNRCHLCFGEVAGRWPAPLSGTLDHVFPVSRGGKHTYDNIKLAHFRCNSAKGAVA